MSPFVFLRQHPIPLTECRPSTGGDERDRTDDPLLAKQVLSQLSYTPVSITFKKVRNEPQKLNNDFNLGP